jgi:hypothetical protein
MKKVIVAIATLCLTLPVSVFAVSLSKSAFYADDTIMFYGTNCASIDNAVNLWDLSDETADGNLGGFPCENNDGDLRLSGFNFSFPIDGHNYSILEVNTNGLCESGQSYSECKALGGFVNEFLFSYHSESAPVGGIISLPESAGTDLFATIGNITSGIWVLISLAIGIPLAFYLIDLIISLLSIDNETRETRIQSQDRYNVKVGEK